MATLAKPKIRYAVIGAGHITQVAVLPAFEHASENSELVALVSGDPQKRAALCDKYGLEHAGGYEELEAVLKRARVDAVYVASPNSEHREHAVRSARAGAHVLCEKPFAPTVADCEAIASACEAARVKLMVAYRLHFEEATLSAIELVKSGKLGQPKAFDSLFGHVVKPGDIRTQDRLAGGALLDLGVYCINAARNLFQAEPVAVTATLFRRGGTDDTTSAVLEFPGERLATFTVSNSIASVSSYRIAGSEGELRVEPAYEYVEPLEHFLTVGEKTKHEKFDRVDQFAPELIYFSRCIQNDEEPEPSAEEGICDVRVVEAIVQSAESGRRVQLEARSRSRRPTLEQVMKKPPVKKPELVGVSAPSVK